MPLAIPVSNLDHTWGNSKAAIELVEYGDFQCPHCGRAYPLVKELKYTFKDSIKLVFRHFPLTRVHPQAMAAAVAAEAAAVQDKFWEMHDMLFDNQAYLNIESLLSYAETIGLDIAKFTDDLQDSSLHDKVENDFMGGMRSGVNGTPTFFVNGERYEGSWEGDNLARYIEEQFGVKQ
ncbi:DsbA family protein [Flavihumibacter solisilvae]|uniref:DSBA oxidoreductase n=1 Tax=Flavihumibacter solisilvae TaxID=1349421 RepID=A0A0C1L6M2_9BACT|nr:thioredoxin domain-containing protein [Flavihumibacter solisilvae]KIC95787.1 DSBA oxidoreductase [Flavihumibacter solisilvae]